MDNRDTSFLDIMNEAVGDAPTPTKAEGTTHDQDLTGTDRSTHHPYTDKDNTLENEDSLINIKATKRSAKATEINTSDTGYDDSERITIESMMEYWEGKLVDIDKMIDHCSHINASDLYIKVGARPSIAIFGQNFRLPSYPVSDEDWNNWSKKNILNEQSVEYYQNKSLDLSYETSTALGYEGIRTRCSLGFSMNAPNAVFRIISNEMPSFGHIDFPKDIQEALKRSLARIGGLTVLSGVTGSGKTTTLASSFNDFSKREFPLHNKTLLTLEDPVEYVYDFTDRLNIIQRELHRDFLSFEVGIRQAVRQHPDYILIGETRDADTLRAAIEACRTGHTALTTFHAPDVKGVISRMINYLSGTSDYMVNDLISQYSLIITQQVIKSDVKFQLRTQYLEFTDEVRGLILDKVNGGSKDLRIIDELVQVHGRDWA